MSSRDYSEIDGAIIEHIRHETTHPTRSEALAEKARELAPRAQPWRLIDRRLQFLNRAGVITFHRGSRSWLVSKNKPEPQQ